MAIANIDQHCLFITSTRLGDAVLSTGVLQALHNRHPQAKITVVCGPLPASIFEACPFVDRVIALKKKKRFGHWIDLWKIVWKTRFTAIVDLRNSFVSRLLCADERFIVSRGNDNGAHKVEQFRRLMGLGAPPAPVLWPQPADAIPPGAPVLALGPAANWHGKTWPIENFIDLTKRLLDGPMQGWRVAVFAAAGERDQVQKLLDAFPDALDLVGKGNPQDMVNAIAQCAFFIGNDSGLMHMAAALNVKTLGLFGPSRHEVYAPWGQHWIRTPESYDELIGVPGYHPDTCGSLMNSLKVKQVFNAVNDTISSNKGIRT